MKKIFSLLLSLGICCLSGMALAACDFLATDSSSSSDFGHEHTFETVWSKDETHHWYACKGTDCEGVSDKEEHTFEENVCTVCSYEKQAVNPTPSIYEVTAEQFNAALSFNDVASITVECETLDGEVVSNAEWYIDGNKVKQVVDGETSYYEKISNDIFMYFYANDTTELAYVGWVKMGLDFPEAVMFIGDYAQMFNAISFDECVYTENIYTYSKIFNEGTNEETTVEFQFQFKNATLTSVRMSNGGTNYDEFHFTACNETTVVLPTEYKDISEITPMPSSEWESYFDFGNVTVATSYARTWSSPMELNVTEYSTMKVDGTEWSWTGDGYSYDALYFDGTNTYIDGVLSDEEYNVYDYIQNLGGVEVFALFENSFIETADGVFYAEEIAAICPDGLSPLRNITLVIVNGKMQSATYAYNYSITSPEYTETYTAVVEHTFSSWGTTVVDATVKPSSCNHQLMYVEAKPAGCTEGNIEYWECELCQSKFTDENAETSIESVSTGFEHIVRYYDVSYDDKGFWTYGSGIFICNPGSVATQATLTITAVVDFTFECEYLMTSNVNYSSFEIEVNNERVVKVDDVLVRSFSQKLKKGDVLTFRFNKYGTSLNIINIYCSIPVKNQGIDLKNPQPLCTQDICCLSCGVLLVEKIAHDRVGHEAKEPTCTEGGWNAYETCNRCSYSTFMSLDALGHDETVHNGQDATCEADGFATYITCSRCGYDTYEKILATGHNWVDATCVAPKTCSNCTLTEGVALGHSITSHEAKAVTCTEDGWNAYETCTRCDYSTYERISALGHDWDDEDICKNCGWSYYTEGLVFSLSEDETYYSVSVGTADDTEIVIPPTYNRLPVKTIAKEGFLNYKKLESLHIPKSIIEIEKYAFAGCINLTEIFFNAGLMEDLAKNNYVFYNGGTKGSGITVNIGKDVQRIPSYLFYPYNNLDTYSPKVQKVIFDQDSVCTAIGSYAFYYCTSLERVDISKNVNEIGDNAFAYCYGLNSIEINANTIKDFSSSNKVFYGAGKNAEGIEVVFGLTVQKIPNYLFYPNSSSTYIPKITHITIGENVSQIGKYAFYQIGELTEINYNAKSVSDLTSSGNVFNGIGQKGDGVTLRIGASVEKIPAYLFYSSSSPCSNIKQIIFEGSSACTSIGNSAFYNCSNFAELTLPDAINSIGKNAFGRCKSLTTLTIPKGVNFIGDYAFKECIGLTNIEVEEGNTVYSAKGDCLIETASKTLILGCGNSIVPTDGTVTAIGKSAFYNCSGLEEIILANCITSIGDSAFYGCMGLTQVIIPNSVNSIGSSAFANCYRLIEVVDKSPLEITAGGEDFGKVGYYAKRIIEDESESGFDVQGEYVFYYAYGVGCFLIDYIGNDTELVLPEAYTRQIDGALCSYTIYQYTFYKRDDLSGVLFIPEKVSLIGDYAFYECVGLQGVTGVDGLPSVGDCSFYGCVGLTGNLKFSEDYCTAIGNSAFSGCSGLTGTLFIPWRVYTIGGRAFEGCSGFTSLGVQANYSDRGCNSIGGYAFSGCSGLKSVYLPMVLTEIGTYAFESCTSLEEINIPYNVHTIGAYAFKNCTSLKEVSLNTSKDWVAGTAIDVSDTEQNAVYLTSTYVGSTWYGHI